MATDWDDMMERFGVGSGDSDDDFLDEQASEPQGTDLVAVAVQDQQRRQPKPKGRPRKEPQVSNPLAPMQLAPAPHSNIAGAVPITMHLAMPPHLGFTSKLKELFAPAASQISPSPFQSPRPGVV